MSFLTVFAVLAVAYINGFTDAPNSIAACVATNVLPLKKALKIVAYSDFFGTILIGLLSGKVSERIILLADLGNNNDLYIISVFSSMTAAVIWSIFSWYFGIPTSESHALLAGIYGATSSIHNGFRNINTEEWTTVLIGMIFSVFIGFIGGHLFSKVFNKIIKKESDILLKKLQIISAIVTAFLHGAQDSQKFVGIIMVVLMSLKSDYKNMYCLITVICGLFISAGILTGGDRIIKTVGNEMVKINKRQGFSADFAGIICLLASTLCGLPVSTTHIKTVSLLGAAKANGEINKKTVLNMFISWIMTFPVCILLSFLITEILKNKTCI